MKLLLTIVACFYSTLLVAEEITFYGNAADVDTGEPIYQEIHNLTLNYNGQPTSETVQYISSSGELLGEKTLVYTTPYAPNYSVEFFHVDRKEIVEQQQGELIVQAKKDLTLELPSSAYAIDGGFHYFIQNNFARLEQGDDVDFDFLSAGRGTFLPLRISPIRSDNNQLVLSLRLKNFFLSKLVKPIELTYSTDNQQLLSYSGLTNVPDADNKLISATITYDYGE